MPIIKVCEQCGRSKTIPLYRATSFHFCSNACHALFLSGGLGKLSRVCHKCGKVDIVSPSRAKRPYCSQACYGQSLVGPRTTAGQRLARRRAKNRAYKARHRQELAERQRQYYQHHREMHEQDVARRRLRTIRGRCDLTIQQWRDILKAYRRCCAYCGLPKTILWKDHVIPLAKGGEHTADNIVPACPPCNRRKSAHFWKPLKPGRWCLRAQQTPPRDEPLPLFA